MPQVLWGSESLIIRHSKRDLQRFKEILGYPLIALVVAVTDQVTKHLVRKFISPYETIGLLPFLQIVHIRNEGAAFGLFRGFGNITFIIISIIAILIVLYLLLKDSKDKLSLSLILGGASGNLIDRIIYGSVTDFIDLYAGSFHWPAFNVADTALTIGIFLMFLSHLREMLKKKVPIEKEKGL